MVFNMMSEDPGKVDFSDIRPPTSNDQSLLLLQPHFLYRWKPLLYLGYEGRTFLRIQFLQDFSDHLSNRLQRFQLVLGLLNLLSLVDQVETF